MLEIRLLHMQQFMESLFHFLIFCGIGNSRGIASAIQTDDPLCVTVLQVLPRTENTVLEQPSSHRLEYLLIGHASYD